MRIPMQKMTNIPMTTCMVWGSESRYDGWNQNENADQKERPRRKTKRTHSFVDRLHWVRLRSTPLNSQSLNGNLFPFNFQLRLCSLLRVSLSDSDLSVDRRTQPQPLDLISFWKVVYHLPALPLSLVTAYHGTLVVTCRILVVFHSASRAWGD